MSLSQVKIYRLVTKCTVEEEIVERAKKKLVLDHLVIQRMGKAALTKNAMNQSSRVQFDKTELADILKFGAAELFREKEGESADLDIDEILNRSESRELNETSGLVLLLFITHLKSLMYSRANGLLNSFKYANFAFDEQKDLAESAQSDETNNQHEGNNDNAEDQDWAQIIPKEEIKRIKEEERQLNYIQQV
jgi:hypothetical protein